MTWEEAEALSAELNQDYPAFVHEVVDTEAETQAAPQIQAAA